MERLGSHIESKEKEVFNISDLEKKVNEVFDKNKSIASLAVVDIEWKKYNVWTKIDFDCLLTLLPHRRGDTFYFGLNVLKNDFNSPLEVAVLHPSKTIEDIKSNTIKHLLIKIKTNKDGGIVDFIVIERKWHHMVAYHVKNNDKRKKIINKLERILNKVEEVKREYLNNRVDKF